MPKWIRNTMIFAIILLNIGCDQVSKKMVRDRLAENETIQWLGDHLTITKVENSGAFLSWGDHLSGLTRNLLLSILPTLFIAFGIFYILSRNTFSRTGLVGTCFIIGGGIGNIIDRVMMGSVTDFLFIRIGFFHTGIFNFADLSIMTGAVLVLIHFILRNKMTVDR